MNNGRDSAGSATKADRLGAGDANAVELRALVKLSKEVRKSYW
jgi:hypothetical protein